MAVLRTQNETAFPVLKSGNYFYLNTKQLFDKLGVNYINANVMFDLSRFEEGDTQLGGDCYKMKMRDPNRKTSDNNT